MEQKLEVKKKFKETKTRRMYYPTVKRDEWLKLKSKATGKTVNSLIDEALDKAFPIN